MRLSFVREAKSARKKPRYRYRSWVQYVCSFVNVRAQTSRHLGLVMCVALSQAAMHSGMSLPVAPPVIDDPPLVAMTSPPLSTIAAVGGAIAAVTGAWGTAPLVAVFSKSRFSALMIDAATVVVDVLAPVLSPLTAGIADSKLAPGDGRVTEVMSVVRGGLTAGVATSSAPVLN